MRLAPAASGVLLLSLVAVSGDRAAGQQAQPQPFQFHLMGDDPRRTAPSGEGQLTCRAFVQAYVNRASVPAGRAISSSPRRWRRRSYRITANTRPP